MTWLRLDELQVKDLSALDDRKSHGRSLLIHIIRQSCHHWIDTNGTSSDSVCVK
jgi:hypothetical protein